MEIVTPSASGNIYVSQHLHGAGNVVLAALEAEQLIPKSLNTQQNI